MFAVARTPAQLFRLMRVHGRTLDDMELVRRSYDFGVHLYTGRFEADGAPFQVHGLGTASVLVQLDAPAHVIGAATFHNAFGNGDWADGRGPGPYPCRRDRIRSAVGPDVEVFLADLWHYRRSRGSTSDLLSRAGSMDDAERWFVLHDLADLLDKWDDGRVGYSIEGRGDRQLVETHGEALVALARACGGNELADSLDAAFTRAAEEEIPDSLRVGRRYSVVVPPPSFRRRQSLVMARRARDGVARVRRRFRTSA